MKDFYGLIYKATNIKNKKVYIGQTIQSLSERRSKHKQRAFNSNRKSIFYTAIRKYKWDVFIWEVIKYCTSKKDLDKAEIDYIKFFKSTNKHYGYNSTMGGDGLREPIDVVRAKLRESGKNRVGFKHSDKTKKAITNSLKLYYKNHTGPNKGRIFSKKVRYKMSVAQKKIWGGTEYRRKMLQKRKAMGADVNFKYKLSCIQKELWKNPQHREKMIKIRKKLSYDENYRKKLSVTNKVIFSSEEHRKARSERIRGEKHPCAIKVKVNGISFNYIKEAAIFFNMVPSTLYSRFNYYKTKNNFPPGWGYLEA